MSAGDRTEPHESTARVRPSSTPAGVRLGGSAVVGVLVATAVALLVEPRFATGAGWCVACATWLLWTWVPIRRMDPGETRGHAVREDNTRAAADLVILLAALISLGAVGYYLAQAASAEGRDTVVPTILGIATITLSWFVIHLTYSLRYARLYYADPEGGIDFNGDRPDYRDFFYFSYNLGMTYQVSDTNVTTKEVRRTVLRHCLLGFLFGVVILGAAINIIAGLGS